MVEKMSEKHICWTWKRRSGNEWLTRRRRVGSDFTGVHVGSSHFAVIPKPGNDRTLQFCDLNRIVWSSTNPLAAVERRASNVLLLGSRLVRVGGWVGPIGNWRDLSSAESLDLTFILDTVFEAVQKLVKANNVPRLQVLVRPLRRSKRRKTNASTHR